MILTVTLNPAIDLLIEVERLDFNTVLRAPTAVRIPAGKGVNVARMIAHLGTPAHALIVAGRDSAAEYAMLANAAGLSVELLTTPGPTRTNLGIHELTTGRHLKINTPGGAVAAAVIDDIIRSIAGAESVAKALVIAGSLPPGLAPDSVAALVTAGRRARIPVFVDAEGDVLRAALAAGPTAVKANLGEWRGALGVDAPDATTLLQAMDAHSSTARLDLIGITDGARGAVVRDETGAWECAPTANAARRSVGAGDAFMAGLVVAWARGRRGAALLAEAMAAAEAVAHHQRGALPPLAEIDSRRLLLQPTEVRLG